MHSITRAAAVAVTTLALSGAAAGVAQADSASAPTLRSTNLAATCHYTVIGNNVAVRRAPDTTAHKIKEKDRGAHVAGPCVTVFNDSRYWTQVYLGRGGTAWMASAFLRYR